MSADLVDKELWEVHIEYRRSLRVVTSGMSGTAIGGTAATNHVQDLIHCVGSAETEDKKNTK